MALVVVTLRPNTTVQLGLGTVVGAASASAALSDNSDSSYVQISSLCQLDSQVVRVGFPTPTLPAGAMVYSVTLRRRIQTVVTGSPIPVCNHWFRSVTGTIGVAGQTQKITKSFFNSPCPTSVTTSAWVAETIGTFTTGPGGQPWNVATNLTGFTYDLGRGDSSTSLLNVSEVYLDVTYQSLSVVTVTGPSSPSTATQPTVTWAYSSPESQPQQSYQVAVYTAAQVAAPGFAALVTTPLEGSGVVLGQDLQWTLPSDITDGSYTAYVQCTSQWGGTGAFPTAISSITWTRASTPASPPPPAVLSGAAADTVNNRVALTFAPGGSSPATSAFTVLASRNGGASYAAIPSLTYLPANGMSALTVYDYVAPLNVASLYQVIAYSGTVLVAATAPSNTLSVTPTGDQHWLKHPSNPLLNTVLPVAAPSESDAGIKITKRRMMVVFQLLGGAAQQVLPFVVNGPTYGDEYAIELVFSWPTELSTYWPAVDELDRSGTTLLFQKPDGTQLWVALGPGASGQETEETYNAQPGTPSYVQWRRRKLTMTQTVAPAYY
jgi:hypothetical protein